MLLRRSTVRQAKINKCQGDYLVQVISGKNYYVRGNGSWVIGRMVRNYEMWMGYAVHNVTY